MGPFTGPCCAYTCLLLSGFSVVFLAVLGCLLATHSETVEIKADQMQPGMIASFTAAGVYVLCVIASVIYLCYHSRQATSRAARATGIQQDTLSSRQRHYRESNTTSDSTAYLHTDEEMGVGGSVQLSSLTTQQQRKDKDEESFL
eukprot:GHVS01054767.1.p1 GENE.GHVS01054767.1~~GHVS01054767.1.p1  ORF type:complete len:145 (+),score=17.77 GHVS01054767.1:177-611(+)